MTKQDKYIAACREIEVRLERGGDLIGDLGNVAAILKKRHEFFWVGFYFLRENHLVLGPFQGTPACVFLSMEKGVCAACAGSQKPIVVPDVHSFEGHVPCDPNSKSEIVVPLFDKHKRLQAVMDVDSDQPESFDEVDLQYLQKIASMLAPCWDT